MYILISIIILFLLHTIIIPRLNHIGKKYKHNIYDLGFEYLPNLRKFAFISDIIIVLCLFTLFIPGMFLKFTYLFIPIMLIRCVTIQATVLPKIKHCKIPDNFYSRCFGGCHDKIFSGHFAFVFLITLLLMEKSYLSLFTTSLINFLHGLLIIAVRNHYSIDVIVSFFVTLCVYQLLYKDKKSAWDDTHIWNNIIKYLKLFQV
jgi:hypothetical protein